jgi:ABC-type nitrate/sulfonate/bicarbonate transport system substrate-binding protein
MRSLKSVSVLLLGLSLMVVSACGNKDAGSSTPNPSTGAQQSPAATKAPTTIKVGLVCGGMTPLLTQIGMNDGSFEKEGLKIEKTCFTAGADAVQALVGGSIDINLGSYEHVLRQQKNGLGVKAYGEIFNGVGYALVVKKDATYQKLSELKDKVLAVTKVGSLSDTGLRAGLEKEGLNSEKDVQIINGGSGATMLAAIESGKAAGGMVSEPTTAQMLATGNYRVLYDPPFEYAGIVVMAKTDWVSKNTEAMKTFLKVNKDVNTRTQKDPQSAVEPMAKEFEQISKDILLTAIKNQLPKVPADLKITKAAADMVVSTQIELGAISKEIPFEKTVDLTLLP